MTGDKNLSIYPMYHVPALSVKKYRSVCVKSSVCTFICYIIIASYSCQYVTLGMGMGLRMRLLLTLLLAGVCMCIYVHLLSPEIKNSCHLEFYVELVCIVKS